MTEDTSDHVRKDLTVDISIDEHEGHTRAKARLRWRDQESVGVGLARLNPADRNVDDIGDELAVARVGRPGPTTDGPHGAGHRSRNPS